ncbi:MAG: beta-galactosidase trimerization domain-containing protein [Anaerolineae bacterium]|nr:beta-galactosidase trimerization domain-containing protein [Anaerolineae bacterium]
MNTELPFRQIHLDFHTSRFLEDIGINFNADEFADTLVKAKVNSINLFARGHHGWIYYETQKYPERRHPHLNCNLLKEQIGACHARGIKTPVYITVQWDHYTATRHPEWRVMNADGSLEGTPPYEDGFYRRLCLNTPYVDWLKGFVGEVIDLLPVDGLWLDIVDAQDCSCWYCQQGMAEMGLEPSNASDRMLYGKHVLHKFEAEMTEFIHAKSPDLLIFYNAGHVGPRHRPMKDWFTHLELESLPSGGWGYLHFPIAARYARTLGLDYLGMTGKFLTTWGDFHSFKNRAALEFECFHMLALNAKCCVGDQLLPNGQICQDTYDLIGSVYSQVAEKEPWCSYAVQVAEIGVFTPEEFDSALHRGQSDFRPIQGAVRMLQETQQQFDIIDSLSDISQYKVLILPDRIPVDSELKEKINTFVTAGGKIIASFASGMDAGQTEITLPGLVLPLYEPGPADTDGHLVRGREYSRNQYLEYIVPRPVFSQGMAETEYAMYMRGMAIQAPSSAQILADTVASYFDRDYMHFCSHRQTPSSGERVHPAVVQQGNIIYFCHPIFSQYQTKAPFWVKVLFQNALARLLPEPIVQVKAPSSLLAMLNKQTQRNRHVLHMLYYVPERRCEEYDVIEDIVPLYDIPVRIRTGPQVQTVKLVPEDISLPFTVEGDAVNFIVPQLTGHCMVEIG